MNKYTTSLLYGLAVALIVVLVVTAILFSVQDSKNDSDFKSGTIDLQTYCNKKTDDGTDSQGIPVVCYKFYGVHAEGQECRTVGKVYQCNPKLVPN